MATLSADQLNRTTLARQLLLDRVDLDVVAAVERVFAIQAQSPASVHLALHARVDDLDLDDVDEALRSHALVRASLLRVTLHVVTAADHQLVRTAMLPTLRASRVHDRRFAAAGLAPRDADRLVEDVVAFASTPRTRTDVLAWLDERIGGDAEPRLWWALRTYAPWITAPTGGPWAYPHAPAYVAAAHGLSTELVAEGDPAHTAAVAHVVRRFLAAFGPATAQDIASFTLLRQRVLRPVLAALADELVEHDGPGDRPLLDVPDGVVHAADTPAPPRLLPMWDSVLLANHGRTRVLPDRHRGEVVRRNGDVLPAMLVDGHVRGVWRATQEGIELRALEPLADETWDALAGEAAGLAVVLAARDPEVYSRHASWWRTLPDDRVHVVAW